MAVKVICISDEQEALVLNLLEKILPDTKAWVYGSRINGKCTDVEGCIDSAEALGKNQNIVAPWNLVNSLLTN